MDALNPCENLPCGLPHVIETLQHERRWKHGHHPRPRPRPRPRPPSVNCEAQTLPFLKTPGSWDAQQTSPLRATSRPYSAAAAAAIAIAGLPTVWLPRLRATGGSTGKTGGPYNPASLYMWIHGLSPRRRPARRAQGQLPPVPPLQDPPVVYQQVPNLLFACGCSETRVLSLVLLCDLPFFLNSPCSSKQSLCRRQAKVFKCYPGFQPASSP